MTEFSLKFHHETPEEQAARRADTSWHLIHGFAEGYSWLQYSSGRRIFASDLRRYGFVFNDWPSIPADQQEIIAAEVAAAAAERLEALRAHYAKHPITFDRILMPSIKSKMPDTDIRKVFDE